MYTYEGVAGDGSQMGYSFTTHYDGMDSPISGVGAPNEADTIAITRVDVNTTKSVSKKNGKVVLTVTSVVSNDGTVATLTAKGTDAQGKAVASTTVWRSSKAGLKKKSRGWNQRLALPPSLATTLRS
jgi:hypothetical protein